MVDKIVTEGFTILDRYAAIINSKEVISFLGQLKDIGITFGIAGGYCRDVVHDLEPKDLDIIVYGTELIELKKLRDFYDLIENYQRIDKAPSGEGNPNLTAVHGVRVDDLDIDIIFYNPLHKSLSDCVEVFDCNLNQYYFDEDDGCIKFAGKNEGILMSTPRGYSDSKRRLRMVYKAGQVDWEFNPDLYN